MRKLLAAPIAALALFAAGSVAHAQGYPAPKLPDLLKGEKIRGVVPNGVGWDWIVEGVADGHHYLFLVHETSDPEWPLQWTDLGEYQPEKEHASAPSHRAETLAKRPIDQTAVATNTASTSFTSSSHH